MNTVSSPSIYRLMTIYWGRYDLLDGALTATDATEIGSPAHQAAYEHQEKAGDNLNEAALAILSFVPKRGIEARIKHSFVQYWVEDCGGSLHGEELTALLASTRTLVAPTGRAA